jgi:hypothetical protein
VKYKGHSYLHLDWISEQEVIDAGKVIFCLIFKNILTNDLVDSQINQINLIITFSIT